MARLRSAGSGMIAVLISIVVAQPAIAQECVSWSTFSCESFAPSAKMKADPEQRLPLGIVPSSDTTAIDSYKLYRVDINCNSTQRLPQANSGIFSRTDYVTSHFIAITDQALSANALPTQARVLIPVYSVGTANANKSRFINDNCNTHFFISGRDPMFLSATFNQAKTTTASPIANLFFAALKVVNPIWPLFVASDAAAILKPNIDGIAATEQPLQQLFAQFNTGETETVSSPIYVGEQNVRTPYSRTTIKVTPIDSLIKNNDQKFIAKFEDSLAGYSDELKADTSDEAAAKKLCDRDANQMLFRNFAGYDAAYGLTLISRTAPLDPGPTLACLGRSFATLSIKEFQPLWQKFKDRTRPITQADIEQYFQDEPPYPIQRYNADFFKRLRNATADYAGAIPNPSEAQRAALARSLDDKVELRNPDRVLDGDDAPTTISANELMQRLVAKGFTKFGCESKDNQAAGLLFAFPPTPKTGDTYEDEEVLPLRAWIGPSGKIVRVDAFSQHGLVSDVAKPTQMWCGSGLHLAGKPKADDADKAAEAGGH